MKDLYDCVHGGDFEQILELTVYYLNNMDKTDSTIRPDVSTIELYKDYIIIELFNCESIDDLYDLATYTENVVTMLKAKESNCNSEFFEILHDITVITILNLTECEVIDEQMYGWEVYFGSAV